VSIVRTKPSQLQSTKVDNVELLMDVVDTKEKIAGCRILYTTTKSTKYVLKNNSDKPVSKFYIEHVADAANGGYVIVTKQNCVKSVTGWSRFEFSLNAQQEIDFIVEERANYSETIRTFSELSSFILRRASVLLAENTLKKEDLQHLKKIVKMREVVAALRQIEGENFSDKDVQRWKAGSVVEPESGHLLPDTLNARLAKLLDLRAKISDVSRVISAGKEHIKVVFTNQQRLRENIKSLEHMTGSDLIKRYLTDLDKEEDDLKATRDRIDSNEVSKSLIEAQTNEEMRLAAVEAKKNREQMENDAQLAVIL